jgi:hypothetical protein
MSHILPFVTLILLLVPIVQCSEKISGIEDPIWQEESLKIAAEICGKIAACGKETGAFQGLEVAQANLTEKRLQEASCQEYHRKTNIFHLAGADPDLIKQSTRECHKQMLELSCDDLVNKKFLAFGACDRMGKIQKGESINE